MHAKFQSFGNPPCVINSVSRGLLCGVAVLYVKSLSGLMSCVEVDGCCDIRYKASYYQAASLTRCYVIHRDLNRLKCWKELR